MTPKLLAAPGVDGDRSLRRCKIDPALIEHGRRLRLRRQTGVIDADILEPATLLALI